MLFLLVLLCNYRYDSESDIGSQQLIPHSWMCHTKTEQSFKFCHVDLQELGLIITDTKSEKQTQIALSPGSLKVIHN